MKKILSLFAVLALATACIYPYQPDFENENGPDGVLVVDGSLLIGEPSMVRIGFMYNMWPKKSDNGNTSEGTVYYYAKAAPYNNIRVWAEDDGGGVYEGALDMGYATSSYSSYYYSPNIPYVLPTENAPVDRAYRVCVQAEGLLYSSDWIKPKAAPVLKKVSFKSSKTDVSVCVTLDGGPEATGYVLLTFDETWRFHADWYPYFDYDPRTNTVSERTYPQWDRYWCWKSSDKGTQIPVDFTGMSSSTLKDYPFHSFSRYDDRNHQRYSIRVKARTIDKETYLYLSHLEENSEAGGGLFTPNPGEVAGNLRCETEPERMVMGYVTVARSTSMRTFIGSNYLLSRAPNHYSLAYPKAYPQMPGEPAWPDYYQMGYMPVEENSLPDPDPNFGPYGWASAPCYDCLAAGGFQTRPDFWED